MPLIKYSSVVLKPISTEVMYFAFSFDLAFLRVLYILLSYVKVSKRIEKGTWKFTQLQFSVSLNVSATWI